MKIILIFFIPLHHKLCHRFLTYNPEKRITAIEAQKSEYFRESPVPIDPSMFPTWPAKSEQVHKRASSPKPPSGGKAYSKLLVGGLYIDNIDNFHNKPPSGGKAYSKLLVGGLYIDYIDNFHYKPHFGGHLVGHLEFLKTLNDAALAYSKLLVWGLYIDNIDNFHNKPHFGGHLDGHLEFLKTLNDAILASLRLFYTNISSNKINNKRKYILQCWVMSEYPVYGPDQMVVHVYSLRSGSTLLFIVLYVLNNHMIVMGSEGLLELS